MNGPQSTPLISRDPREIEVALRQENPEYFDYIPEKVLRNAISQALTYKQEESFPVIRSFVMDLLAAENRADI